MNCIDTQTTKRRKVEQAVQLLLKAFSSKPSAFVCNCGCPPGDVENDSGLKTPIQSVQPSPPQSTQDNIQSVQPSPTPQSTSLPWIPDSIPNQAADQITPEFRKGNISGAAGVREITALSQKDLRVTDQSLTGNTFTNPSDWSASVWDGATFNPCGKSNQDLCSFFFPTEYTMRGLEAVYNTKKPFQNPKDPTVGEIDAWNVAVVEHLRKLIGSTRPIVNDKCLYAKAQWASERKNTSVWDDKYKTSSDPTDVNMFGPCGQSSDFHCGFTFMPNCDDQTDYLGGTACCPKTAKVEGLCSVVAALPWSLKFVNVMHQYICDEGMTGHAGPLFSCTRMGVSWTIDGSNVLCRGQWEDYENFNPCP